MRYDRNSNLCLWCLPLQSPNTRTPWKTSVQVCEVPVQQVALTLYQMIHRRGECVSDQAAEAP